MKKIIATILLLFFLIVTFGQAPNEGKRNFYYHRFSDAGNIFHSALQQDPANAEAWFWLCRTYLQQQQSSKATDTLKLAPAASACKTSRAS